ncbi:MAG TPA: type II toxin-antitoxin system VapC family toxin [Acidobacteriaceae bacterium]|nr:type II toxin-antitoxin system VapC family toxin [Acidobacteriaceae bacterium]
MAFVLDVSVTAAWAFSDEVNPHAFAILSRMDKDHALVPPLWWFEVRNVLIVNERRKRITESATAAFLRRLAQLPIQVESLPQEPAILRLARAHGLSVYDAAYLELAMREGISLATEDAGLVRAATAEAVTLL